MKLNIEVLYQQTGATTVVDEPHLVLSGRFDANESGLFRETFDRIDLHSTPTVRLDLSKVDFVDSAALAEMVRATKRCRQADGDLVLTRPSSPVQVILELTGLDKAFTVDRRA